jgi:hypothetical protein
MTKIAVGSDVDAYCTKCKMVLGHTVAAMDGARPRRVKCNTCGGEHNYRPTKPVGKVAAGKKADKPKAAPRKTRQTWEEVMQEASTRPRKTYSMAGTYSEGEWIEHATFGMGLVESVTPPNKITVKFADGPRNLVYNRR